MSRTSHNTDGTLVGTVLSVADLLAEPRLARVYDYLSREGPATVDDVRGSLSLSQTTAYEDVDRLVEADVIERDSTDQPQTFTATEFELTVTDTETGSTYTITPALVAAVARRTTDDDVDTYIDRHGIDGLAGALGYAVARERGELTHRTAARELDVSPLAAELILQGLRPVVHEYFDVEPTGGSVEDIETGRDDGTAGTRE